MLRFIVLWGVTGCKAVSVIKSDRRARVEAEPRRPRYHHNSSLTYLTFPDQPFCIIFQMTFSVTYFISHNATLNLVKCMGARTDWRGLDGRGSEMTK